ncbi:helix-turn-helix domain-containing protein [Senimuribacter intestinalis]|uniref:helix-turn-helix domain-containing protein n=1 Tax=Senimuribacter intestinalis TaxID=2941507 RepID=UPI00203D203E|nr:helix-turn-helix transcriptional regulator [Senimuribacter intestinalis]
MTNTSMLNDYILKSGIKKKKIAETLGISYTSLRKKMNNAVDFRADEVLKMCKLLGINNSATRDAIFFNENVGK